MTRPWGSIRIRGGSIALRYRLPSGERVQETLPVGTTKKEAQRLLTERHYGVLHGTTLRPSSVTVAELLRDWLAADHGWAPASLRMRTDAAGWVRRCLGAVRLADLEIGHVEAMKTSLKEGTNEHGDTGHPTTNRDGATEGRRNGAYDTTGRRTRANEPPATPSVAAGAKTAHTGVTRRSHGLSPETVNMALGCLGMALRWGMQRELVSKNVVSQVRRLAVPRPNKKALDPADAAKLYRTCMAADPAHPQARLVAFLMSTMIRCGWDDHGHVYNTDDNSKHRYRTCQLPMAAVKVLERQRRCTGILRERAVAYGAVWADSEVVFPSLYGRPMPRHSLQKALNGLCAEAGVPRLSIHELRHTGISLHASLGTSTHELLELTGWRAIPPTYIHLFTENVQRAADRLGDLLEGVS